MFEQIVKDIPSRYERLMARRYKISSYRLGIWESTGTRTLFMAKVFAFWYGRVFGFHVTITDQRPDASRYGNFTGLSGEIRFSDYDMARKSHSHFKQLQTEFWEWAETREVPMELEILTMPERFETVVRWGVAEPVECPGT